MSDTTDQKDTRDTGTTVGLAPAPRGEKVSAAEWPKRRGGAKHPNEPTSSRYAPYFDGEVWKVKRMDITKDDGVTPWFVHVHYLANAFHSAADRLGVRIQVRSEKENDLLYVRRVGGKIWDAAKKDIVEPPKFQGPLTTLPDPAPVDGEPS